MILFQLRRRQMLRPRKDPRKRQLRKLPKNRKLPKLPKHRKSQKHRKSRKQQQPNRRRRRLPRRRVAIRTRTAILCWTTSETTWPTFTNGQALAASRNPSNTTFPTIQTSRFNSSSATTLHSLSILNPCFLSFPKVLIHSKNVSKLVFSCSTPQFILKNKGKIVNVKNI